MTALVQPRVVLLISEALKQSCNTGKEVCCDLFAGYL